MSKLAELAASRSQSRPFDPSPDLTLLLLAARDAGHGYRAISAALKADGHDVGKDGVQAWFERHDRQASPDDSAG